MKETRKYQFSNRSFTKQDLSRLAHLIFEQSRKAEVDKDFSLRKFSLHFQGDIEYQSNEPDIFDQVELTDYRRLYYASISCYGTHFDITVDFHHGNCRDCNVLTVSSTETGWVNETFTRVKELIDGCNRTQPWVTQHPILLLFVVSLGVGTLVTIVIASLLLLFFPFHFQQNSDAKGDIILFFGLTAPTLSDFAIIWGARLLSGIILSASILRRLLDETWPNIEIDIGPEYAKREKKRRRTLVSIWSAILLPLLLSGVLEFVKKVIGFGK